jgi:flagellar hook-associated protein 1 FlgK
MPISSFYGLQTSLRGLLAMQRSIDVTSHNIANASTVGYSRQEASLAASQALHVPGSSVNGGGHIGSGVDIQSYRRIRDTFLDLQYRGQATALGDQTARSGALNRAELALAEPSSDGLSAQLTAFWNSWSDVANAPESVAARQALVSQATALAGAFASIDQQLATVGTQAGLEYTDLTAAGGEVAAIADEIAGLNNSIKTYMTVGDAPNDLMDRRDLLLDQLSKLGKVSVTPGSEAGSIQVAFGDAAEPLVSDGTVTWPQVLTAPGGRLGALLGLSSATGDIATYRGQLNAIAKTLADGVNAVHATGPGGVPFFNMTAGAEASSLSVAVTAATVATSSTTAAGANDIARAVAAMRGGAADGAYQSFVAGMGTDVRAANRGQVNAEVLTGAVDDRRQSVSGVAMDEEMSNLVRFQRAYQASARAMSTMDEMLDILVNRTGRVGL